jgi:Periplasmic binding protein-like domain
LARDDAVTAIFVANDLMALGVLRALHEHGRDVPGEISVVGFDDSPEAEVLSPAAHYGASEVRRDGAEQPSPPAERDAEPRCSSGRAHRRARTDRSREHGSAGLGRSGKERA